MKVIVLNVLKAFLIAVYFPLKLLPIKKNKVVFLSRQTNGVNLDYRLIQDYLKSQSDELYFVNICRRYEKSIWDNVMFVVNILRSLYHLATSRVCVVDGYWPAVSMLRHKKKLTVVQIWHAMGKIKKSGYQSLYKKSGRNPKVAKAMEMHKNYDVIIAGAKAWNPYYCESFGVTEDKLLNCGLPRCDYLLEKKEENREKIERAYPWAKEKIVLLYAPTFRRGWDAEWERLWNAIDHEKYALIVKAHPNQELKLYDGCHTCDEFSAVELLSTSDYLITDYSAISVEAALLDVKTFYYVYDYETYDENNGLNIDLFKEMPGCVFKDADELMKAVSEPYPQDVFNRYKEKYLPSPLGASTKTVGDYILNSLGKEI